MSVLYNAVAFLSSEKSSCIYQFWKKQFLFSVLQNALAFVWSEKRNCFLQNWKKQLPFQNWKKRLFFLGLKTQLHFSDLKKAVAFCSSKKPLAFLWSEITKCFCHNWKKLLLFTEMIYWFLCLGAMLYLSFLLELIFGFLGAVEVAALRSLCKSAALAVTCEGEESFNFTFPPVRRLLPKFTREAELLWVVERMAFGECLLQKPVTLETKTRLRRSHWRNMGLALRYRPTGIYKHRELARLVRAFWWNPEVMELRATALRLDSISLLRRVAKEAPGVAYPDEVPHADGEYVTFLFRGGYSSRVRTVVTVFCGFQLLILYFLGLNLYYTVNCSSKCILWTCAGFN